MRPVGVSIIAALIWFVGALWALAGFSVIGFTHLGGRWLASMSDAEMLGRITSGLGGMLGVGMLLIAVFYLAVGFGLWNLKSWARVLTLIFVVLGLLLGLRSVIEYHHVFRVVRTAVDAAILIYLFMPEVRKVFV